MNCTHRQEPVPDVALTEDYDVMLNSALNSLAKS